MALVSQALQFKKSFLETNKLYGGRQRQIAGRKGRICVYDTFRLAPAMWVGAIWDRLRNVRQEDVGRSGEQFKWVIAYVLEKLDTRFSVVKIREF
jgi:hypothetical protein